MSAEAVLQSRVLGGIAVVLAAVLTVVGIQQAAVRAIGEVESSVLAPLAVAVLFAAIVVLAGQTAAGARRTPYW